MLKNIVNSVEIRNRNKHYRQDPADRVLVVVDVRNVCNGQSKNYGNTVIDYSKMVDDIVGCRKCVAAIAVDGLVYDENEHDKARVFHNHLRSSGLRLELVRASNGMGKQEGVDLKIGLLAQRYVLMEKCDCVELVTGDGDFTVLVEELHNLGVNVNVSSFNSSLSRSISAVADSVNSLDDMPIVPMAPKFVKEVH